PRRRAGAPSPRGTARCSGGTSATARSHHEPSPSHARHAAAGGGVEAPRIEAMMRRIDLRGAAAAAVDLGSAVPRAAFDVEAAVHVVRPICDDVRARGVEAIVEYSACFDGVEQTDIAVPVAALQ